MKKAFTLIELLIVIAIVGILAVAVLIALDPIEQTNRANDVKLITASGEIRQAMNRYYASKLFWPWCTTSTCAAYRTGCAAGGGAGGAFATSGTCAASILAELQTAGELKTAVSPDTKINLNYSPAAGTFFIYYNAYSKATRTQYAPAVNQNGVFTNATCATPGDSSTCPNTSTTCMYCVF